MVGDGQKRKKRQPNLISTPDQAQKKMVKQNVEGGTRGKIITKVEEKDSGLHEKKSTEEDTDIGSGMWWRCTHENCTLPDAIIMMNEDNKRIRKLGHFQLHLREDKTKQAASMAVQDGAEKKKENFDEEMASMDASGNLNAHVKEEKEESEEKNANEHPSDGRESRDHAVTASGASEPE